MFDFLSKNRPNLTVKEIVSYSADILLGLEYIHAKGYIHRDIKTTNILLTAVGNEYVCQICDLGLSKLYARYEVHSPIVMTGTYRSPECAATGNYDTLADCWSAGCVLYELTNPRYITGNVLPRSYVPHGIAAENADLLAMIGANLPYQTPHSPTPTSPALETFMLEHPNLSKHDNQLFREVVMGLLQFDLKRRRDCTQTLTLPLFNLVRDKISAVRRANPVINEITIYRIFQCPVRQRVVDFVLGLIRDTSNYTKPPLVYTNHKGVFQALEHFDMMLDKARADIDMEKSMVNIVTYFLSILYTVYKSGVSSSSSYVGLKEFLPAGYDSDQNLALIGCFESRLVKEILGFRVFTETPYIYALKKHPVNPDAANELLMLVCLGHHGGRTAAETYQLWQNHKTYYREQF